VSGCHQQLPFDNPLIEVELNFIEECAQFPNGRHDDQVDQMTELPPREPTRLPTKAMFGSVPPGTSWRVAVRQPASSGAPPASEGLAAAPRRY